MAPSTSGGADALTAVMDQVGQMELTEVRSLLEKLVERRLLAPLSGEDQLVWSRLIDREQELLAGT
ncbi:MAG TPA: hypothetical protein VFH50_08275 [Acidimicrobiales bacterium]|nr:hypothetical protein [Acidimicrobiales bacterium]